MEAILLLLLIPTCACDQGTGVDGSTDIFAAAADGDINAVRQFLSQLQENNETLAAELGKRDQNGWSLVHLAAKHGHTNVMELLLDAGADVNSKLLSNSTSVSTAGALNRDMAPLHVFIL